MEEPLRPGEAITLLDADAETLGRIVSLTPDGDRAEVRWHRRPGHEHGITVEPVTALRRVHESEIIEKAD